MVFGLAFDGWAWSWLFFLVPGVLGIWMYSDDYFRGRAIAHTDRAAYRAERNPLGGSGSAAPTKASAATEG